MLYQSTRNNRLRIEAHEAILRGISDDGGLFVPTEIPLLCEVDKLRGKNYYASAKEVLSSYLTDFTPRELSGCIRGAYGNNKFGSSTVAPVVKLGSRESVLELWHGPTCAFKDMALQILPRFLIRSMEKASDGEKVMILVATSGDTGKAALEGFKNVKNTRILVFYPSDGVSNMQKLQMMTQEGNNVRVCGIQGNFDDAQTGVKRIFNSPEMKEAVKSEGYSFSSANSINWGRLVPQIVYYVNAYVQMLDGGLITDRERFNVCVPTGNFGDILAAYYARRMGVPIKKLVCASNCNDVLTEFLQTGTYNRKRPFHTTISPSMDILISSNLERLLFDICHYDSEYINYLYQTLAKKGSFTVKDEWMEEIQTIFYGGSCTDEETMATIKNTFEHKGYLMDPHTAVAQCVYEKFIREFPAYPTLLVSTASPYKFPESVLKSLGAYEKGLDEFALLDRLSEISNTPVPTSLSALKEKKVRFNGVIPVNEMDGEVLSAVR